MESKNLHKHVLPIVVMAIAGLIGSVGITTWLTSHGSVSPTNLQASLVSPLISLQPGKDGFANVRLQIPANPNGTLGDTETNVGSEAALTFALQPPIN